MPLSDEFESVLDDLLAGLAKCGLRYLRYQRGALCGIIPADTAADTEAISLRREGAGRYTLRIGGNVRLSFRADDPGRAVRFIVQCRTRPLAEMGDYSFEVRNRPRRP